MIINDEYVKGSVHHDHSLKEIRNGGRRVYHNCWRIVVSYGNRTFRRRFNSKQEALAQLIKLKEKYYDFYFKSCDWCGTVFEYRNANTRYCCPRCGYQARKARQSKSLGYQILDANGHNTGLSFLKLDKRRR